jgi:hypothetical protein
MTRMRMGLLLGLLLALAACSGGGGKPGGVASLGDGKATSTTSAGGSQDERQADLAFARCMRQHGINIPDPKPDGRVDMRGSGVDRDDPKFKAAERACPGFQPKY